MADRSAGSTVQVASDGKPAIGFCDRSRHQRARAARLGRHSLSSRYNAIRETPPAERAGRTVIAPVHGDVRAVGAELLGGEVYVRWLRPDGVRMAMTLLGYIAGALYVGRGAGGPADVAYIRGSVAFPRSNYTYTNDIPGETSINWELSGFGWHEKWQLHDYRQIKWIAPFWGIFLATAALPVAWTLRFRSRLRARRIGLCRICGYDLRATPDRCPEFGAVAASKPRGLCGRYLLMRSGVGPLVKILLRRRFILPRLSIEGSESISIFEFVIWQAILQPSETRRAMVRRTWVILGIILCMLAVRAGACPAAVIDGYTYSVLENRSDLNGIAQIFTATAAELDDASILLCQPDPAAGLAWWSQAHFQVRSGTPQNFDGSSGNVLFNSSVIDFGALPSIGTGFDGKALYELKLSDVGLTTPLQLVPNQAYSLVITDPGTTGTINFAANQDSPMYAGGDEFGHNRGYSNSFRADTTSEDLAFQVVIPEPSSAALACAAALIVSTRRRTRRDAPAAN